MATIGLDMVEPEGEQGHARLMHLAPAACLYRAGAARTACYVIRRGFALRRGANGLALRAVGLAGPGEVLALDDLRTRRHGESAHALCALDVAAVELSTLRARSGLQARIIAGPQSLACMGHWQRHMRWVGLTPRERLAASLRSLAETARTRRIDLDVVSIGAADLAHWLAMPPDSALDALQHLAQQGLLRLSDGVAGAIDTDALLARTDPATGAATPAQAPGDSKESS